jgi:hypothetical protein
MKNNEYPTWLVPIDIAKELKKIGFNEPCLYYNSEAISGMGYQCIEIEERIHNEDPNVIELRELKYFNYNKTKGCTSIPTWEQVFKWFRERGLFSYIRPNMGAMDWYSYRIYDRFDIEKGRGMSFYYENARLFCMETLIEIFKERQRNKEKRTM